ncbi:pollen-specific leucine-rich repeat extensin-like protein 3, partial [Tanacetum coccineum]
MKALCCFLFLSFLSISSSRSLSLPLNNALATRRHLAQTKEDDQKTRIFDFSFDFHIDARFHFPNPRLRQAYAALQEWKKFIFSDPGNMLSNWEGDDVCSYNGIFCEKAPDNPNVLTVAGIDLNHGDIAGQLVPHLGLLTDLSVFHINSNRFCGIVPESFSRLAILHEFDISNNRFVGPFPNVVLEMAKLKYLDIRYNNFEGALPSKLFDKDLDAIFLNDNRFSSNIPENIGNSNASVIVLADNGFTGCIPQSMGRMTHLDEVIFANNQLTGCVPEALGSLENITVLDLSRNKFVGKIPQGFEGLKGAEMIDIAHNELIGTVVESICT